MKTVLLCFMICLLMGVMNVNASWRCRRRICNMECGFKGPGCCGRTGYCNNKCYCRGNGEYSQCRTCTLNG